jgi:hypothetical protein
MLMRRRPPAGFVERHIPAGYRLHLHDLIWPVQRPCLSPHKLAQRRRVEERIILLRLQRIFHLGGIHRLVALRLGEAELRQPIEIEV